MQLLGRAGCSVVFSGFRAYGALKSGTASWIGTTHEIVSTSHYKPYRVWDLGCRGLKFGLKMHQTLQLLLIEGVMVPVTGLV